MHNNEIYLTESYNKNAGLRLLLKAEHQLNKEHKLQVKKDVYEHFAINSTAWGLW